MIERASKIATVTAILVALSAGVSAGDAGAKPTPPQCPDACYVESKCQSKCMKDTELLVFDAGAGVATLTRFGDGSTMIFDTGIDDNELFKSMKDELRGDEIDLLVISTPSKGHAGLSARLLHTHRVHRVVRPCGGESNTTFIDFGVSGKIHDIELCEVQLPQGLTYRFGRDQVRLFHTEDIRFRQKITAMVIASGESKVQRALLTPDLIGRDQDSEDLHAIQEEKALIEAFDAHFTRDEDKTVSVMLAPSYGRNVASSDALIAMLKPAYAVFPSSGKNGGDRTVERRYAGRGVCTLGPPTGDKPLKFTFAGTSLDISHGTEKLTFGKQCEYQSNPPLQIKTIRKSGNDECYPKGHAYYKDMPKNQSYENMAACLKAGGNNSAEL